MQHRHLNHAGYTLSAIDDTIERGGRDDWVELRRAAEADAVILQKILRVCRPHVAEPYAQRYHLWRHYAERKLA